MSSKQNTKVTLTTTKQTKWPSGNQKFYVLLFLVFDDIMGDFEVAKVDEEIEKLQAELSQEQQAKYVIPYDISNGENLNQITLCGGLDGIIRPVRRRPLSCVQTIDKLFVGSQPVKQWL